MYWNFCYRSMNRAEIVRLETITDSEVEARKLAAIRLEAEGRPPSAFVWLRPACVARSVDYPDLVAKYGTPEQKRQFAAAAPDGSLPAVH